MADSAFTNMFRRGIIPKLGLDQSKITFGHDYTYIEVPFSGEFFDPIDESVVTKAKKGQRLKLIPATNISNTTFPEKCLVVVNPALTDWAEVPSMQLVEAKVGDKINILAKFYRDTDLAGLGWLCRVYVFN